MDEKFLPFNKHLENSEQFSNLDPHLSQLKQYRYVQKSNLLEKLPTKPGIYTLIGGILVGKTTLLKQWVEKLLMRGIPPKDIIFFSGELIDHHTTLIQLLQKQLENKPETNIQYVIIDDVTFVDGWDKAIKFLFDQGLLPRVILVLASSDKAFSQKLKKDFPSRQNEEDIDFHLYPLSFSECVLLKNPQMTDVNLFEEFDQYLLHGGYLIAMNDIASDGKILHSTLQSYSDRLRKEMLRRGRQENYLHDILKMIIEHYNKPMTWNLLTHESSINHPKTIGDYIEILESMDVLFVQYALAENLTKAPKKARKVMFFDPFIFHSIRAWVYPVKNSFATQIKPLMKDVAWNTKLAITSTITQYSRYYPTYYIKDEGEVSLAYIYAMRFWPVLIIWADDLHAKNLKQILKYPNGKILTKSMKSGIIEYTRTEPLPQALLKLQD